MQGDESAPMGLISPGGKNGYSRYLTIVYNVLFQQFQLSFLFTECSCRERMCYINGQFHFLWKFPLFLNFFFLLFRVSSMSPNAKMARIASLENMLSMSSNALVAMASQLSEAEERDRAFTGRGRWSQLRSMADAKSLLQYMFNVAADARSIFWLELLIFRVI